MNIEKLIIVCGVDTYEMNRFAAQKLFDQYTIFKNQNLILKFPENNKHPFHIKDDLDKWLNANTNSIIITHSEFVFTYLRRLVAEEAINFLNLEIYWIEPINNEAQKLTINKHGFMDNWPGGMFDSSVMESHKILSLAIKK